MHIVVIGLRGIPDVIGGIETHCRELYPRVRELDPSIKITVLIRQGYNDRKLLDFRGLRIKTIWSPHVWGVDTVIHSFLSILYARLRLHPDIVHLHGIGPGFFAPVAKLLGFRVVVTHHAQDYLRPKWSASGRLFLTLGERFTAFAADRIVCVSAALAREFLNLYPRAATRTLVIPNASALPPPGPAEPGLAELGLTQRGYVLAVGRLEATKRFDELIAAFRMAGLGAMKLVILGSGIGNEDYAAELRRAASERVVFAGFQRGAALRWLYDNAAVFVHPSGMEGFGLVISEALEAGLPVILSDIPPHREFGLPDACYFPSGDVPALVTMLSAPSFDRYRAPAASERQRGDSWDRVARAHLALFRALGGAKAAAAG